MKIITGFSSEVNSNSTIDDYVLLNDPDNAVSPPGIQGGEDIKILLSTFGHAIINGRGLEPKNIAGIVVTS